MNDYLHNLVARTLQLAPLVRPRLPSLFEPLAAGQAVNVSSSSDTVHADGTRTRQASDVSPGPVNTRGQQVTSETVSRTTTSGIVEGDTGKNFEWSRRAEPRPSELTRSTREIVAPVLSQTIGSEAPSIPTLITKAARTTAPRLGPEASATEPAARGLLERPRVDTRPIDSPAEVESREHRDPVETTAMRALVSRAVGPAMRHDHGERSAASDLADPFPAPETTPTINVTIGRVDVRAVFPQPQAQPARRARPAPMSLDEYVRQRSEGRK